MPVLLPTVVFIGALYILYRYYPPFGGRLNKARKLRASQSANHDGKKFVNYMPTSMDMDRGEVVSMMRDQFRSNPQSRPPRPLHITPVNAPDTLPGQRAQVTWLGHSTMLIYIRGKALLCDPVFNKRASPLGFVGPKRFATKNPVTVHDLPPVDAVCISHDHYDHLDHQTIKKLKNIARHFFVPLGVGAHLEKWGIAPARITELDWWEETTFEGLRLACTPSRHFSGRTLTDRFQTLWASWVISDGITNLFFSGDTGYGTHFKKIGKKYGPFDLTMLECGQYDSRWPNIHMTPEQTAAAHLDLHGKRLLPMHWGAFKLAFHTWTEPVERVLVAATANGSQVATPRLGETMDVISKTYPTAEWWNAYMKPDKKSAS